MTTLTHFDDHPGPLWPILTYMVSIISLLIMAIISLCAQYAVLDGQTAAWLTWFGPCLASFVRNMATPAYLVVIGYFILLSQYSRNDTSRRLRLTFYGCLAFTAAHFLISLGPITSMAAAACPPTAGYIAPGCANPVMASLLIALIGVIEWAVGLLLPLSLVALAVQSCWIWLVGIAQPRIDPARN